MKKFLLLSLMGFSALVSAQTPKITALGPTTFCNGGSVVLESNMTGGNQWYRNGTLISGATGQQYTATIGASYNVRVNGVNSNLLKVIVNPLPSAATTPTGNVSLCPGSSLPLTANAVASGGSYLWSTGATTQSIYATSAGTYSVTVTGPNGCSKTSAVITVAAGKTPATPVAEAVGSPTICQGGNVTLKASASAGYQWYRNSVLIAGATAQYYTATTAGSYSVKAYNGCYSAMSNVVKVFVNPLPVATLSPTGTVDICNGSSTTLTASGAGSGGSYLWSNGETTASIIVQDGGNYSVTAINQYGCSSVSGTTTVAVHDPIATISPSGSQSMCEGSSMTLTASGGDKYYWSTGETTQSINVTSDGTFTVQVWDAYGCSNTSAATQVTMNSKPVVDAGAGQTTYLGYGSLSVNLEAQASSGTAPYSYSWSSGATTAATTVSPSSTTTYYVTVTDSNGCSGVDSVTVTVIDLRCGVNNDMVTVCHIENGYHTICVDQNSVQMHLDHGDYLGNCVSNLKTAEPVKVNTSVTEGVTVSPNPFTNISTLKFVQEEDAQVKIEVLNLLGERVMLVKDGFHTKGHHSIMIDLGAADYQSGVYFLKVQRGADSQVLRIIKSE